MGILTEDMKRVVRQQRLGFIATVCPDGSPNLSPKGTATVWDDDHLVFSHGGTLWIPLETTLAYDGFDAAWRDASSWIGRYLDNGRVEMLPVSNERDRFPALPLPPSSYRIVEPPTDAVAPRVDRAEMALQELLSTRHAARLDSGTAVGLIRLGTIAATFGHPAAAVERALALAPRSAAVRANLATALIMDDRIPAAIDVLEADTSDSVIVRAALAQARFANGEVQEARRIATRLARDAPSLAARLDYIGTNSGDLGRAGRASEQLVPLWQDLPADHN